MAVKQPKHRRIPRTLLRLGAFKRFEDKVILWLHVLELASIVVIAGVVASMATFLNVKTPINMAEEVKKVTPVEAVEDVEATAVEADKKNENISNSLQR